MLTNLKALVVVLALATFVFALAKPLCLRFTAPEDFARRRAVWYALTVVAFVSPSFWLYAVVAVPLMAWAGKKDANPEALFLLLLFVIPPVSVEIPTIGIKRLFDLNQVRLLGFAVLWPVALARLRESKREGGSRFTAMDVLLLMYGALQVILLIPYESPTNTGRRAFLFLLDDYLLFFVFARMGSSKAKMTDVMGTLCLNAAVLAAMGVFESTRHWLLYTGVPEVWGSPNVFAWLFRGDALRAQASTGHAIPLGYMLAIGIGCLLYIKAHLTSKPRVLAAFALLSVGMYFSYSRGPWVTAVIAVLVSYALGSRSATNFFKWMIGAGAIVAVVLATPMGAGIVDQLPIVGSVGQETVDYRQQLAETSWRLIQEHPIFGNPFVLLDMEELRQGQGIIDLVNAYATVALFYGGVGLTLFCGIFAIGLTRAFVCMRRWRTEDHDMVVMGACLIGCMVATLFFMGTAGFAWMQWELAGLLASYAAVRFRHSMPQQFHSSMFGPAQLFGGSRR